MKNGDDNVLMLLPSGVRVTRLWRRVVNSPAYVLPPGGGTLLPADVEALYADSIAGDGGRELRELREPLCVCVGTRYTAGVCETCGRPGWTSRMQRRS